MDGISIDFVCRRIMMNVHHQEKASLHARPRFQEFHDDLSPRPYETQNFLDAFIGVIRISLNLDLPKCLRNSATEFSRRRISIRITFSPTAGRLKSDQTRKYIWIQFIPHYPESC